jgi:diguanylate cyclase (GGDEF)-like protein
MPGSQPTERDPAPSLASPRAVRALIAVGDGALAQRVREALDGERFHVATSAEEFSDTAMPEIIVTDQTLASEALAPFYATLERGEVGVVLLGKALPADVLLSLDFTRRELRLACRMLAQIVSLRKQNQRLYDLAHTDPLTGLANRRALEEHAAKLLARAPLEPLALAVFDLDQFKRINAEFGYARGDSVLRSAGKTLASRAPQQFVARLGGDEFVALWSAPDREEALQLVDGWRRAMGTAASLKAERPVSASAGVAVMVEPPDLAALLAAADLALRQAKKGGGKRCELASL